MTFAGAGTLSNTGVVNGQYGNGVAFAQYGKLVNSGTVKGQYAGFFPNGGIITNTATIAGDQHGIQSLGVLNINNAAGASITAGTIKATGSTSSANYTNRYVAIQSPGGTGPGRGGGSVTNLAGGLITSTNSGILLSGGAATVANAGTIGGGTFSGNYAVSMAAGFNNRLVLSQGAVFNGKVNGGGATSVLELTSAASAGTISGIGSKYLNFGTIALDNLATWTLSGPVTSGTKVAFVPGGAGTMILASPTSMAGTITGFGVADFIQLPGILTNATGGTLGAGNTLSIPQTNGQTLTLNFDLTQSLTPVVIAQSDGSSYVCDYNPSAAPSNEIATHFSGPVIAMTVLRARIPPYRASVASRTIASNVWRSSGPGRTVRRQPNGAASERRRAGEPVANHEKLRGVGGIARICPGIFGRGSYDAAMWLPALVCAGNARGLRPNVSGRSAGPQRRVDPVGRTRTRVIAGPRENPFDQRHDGATAIRPRWERPSPAM